MQPKKVLIITYYWPPAGGVSVQRVLKFCKYLPEYNVQPIVLTVDNGSYPNIDTSLLKDIPESVKIYKSPTLEPFAIYNFLRGRKGNTVPMVESGVRKKSLMHKLGEFVRANFFIPDARVGWNFFARSKAREIIEREAIDTVITTGPPHSTHLIGLYLKKKLGVKWIVDFRDPWVELFASQFLPRTRMAIAIDRCLENKVIRHADKIVLIGERLKYNFQLENFSDKVHVITNGYDLEGINFLPKEATEQRPFIIRYVGSFFTSQDIPAFWYALDSVVKDTSLSNKKVIVEFIGSVDADIKERIKQHDCAANILYKPFVSHAEALQLMHDADALLLVIPNTSNNQSIITGKIFEYLAMRKPIICFGPKDGDAADIILNTISGEVFDYSYAPLLSEFMHNLLTGNSKLEYNGIDRYSRRRLASDLSQLISQ
jgi:glycosyltransferase involved in cell wall biosynthesis